MTAVVRGSGEPPHKMAKLDTPLPANVIIQFQSDTGDIVGEFRGALYALQGITYHTTFASLLHEGSVATGKQK